ncbi:MAG TPA: hypothetical protein VF510_00985, partial [Ktedonobacterales bacterium]
VGDILQQRRHWLPALAIFSVIWRAERNEVLVLHMLFARMAAADIAANLVEPSMNPLRSMQTIQVFPRFQECFLHHIVHGIRSNTPQVCQAS